MWLSGCVSEGMAAAGAALLGMVLPFGAPVRLRGWQVTSPKRSPLRQAPGGLCASVASTGGASPGETTGGLCAALAQPPAAYGAGTPSCPNFHPIPSALFHPFLTRIFFFFYIISAFVCSL